MIYYKENPEIAARVVKLQSGENEYRNNCKKIKGLFYRINEECFEVDGSWYPKDTGHIIYDHAKNNWVLKSKARNMIHGIVKFHGKDTPVMGYFTPSYTDMVTVVNASTGDEYPCISADIAKEYCVEEVSRGKFWYNCTASRAAACRRIMNAVNNKEKGYNIEDNVAEMEQKIQSYNTYPTKINRTVNMFSKLLGDISFGAELECIRGYLPDYIQHRTGTVVCRDGSLHDADGSQGPEFTTIPLTGAKGVQSLIDLCSELTPRTIVDKHCALHLHLGNLPTSRVFLVALYRLCYMIQDELFTMFPYYKVDERKYAGKDKNYCKKLSRLSIFSLKKCNRNSYEYYINDNYTRIFTFLSNGVVPCKNVNRKLGVHPKATDKWNKTSRYYWINFMNVIFSKRNTVEFRIHQGTTNPQKVISWLFICNAIVKTAMQRTSDILTGKKLSLNDVLDYYSNSHGGRIMSEYLKYYVQERKNYFRNDFEKNDYMSEGELAKDNSFELPFDVISNMFKNKM